MTLIQKQSRAFNSITIDRTYDIVYKRSEDSAKLQAESFWYKEIPLALQGFVPKVIMFADNTLRMEYCPYTTLSEIFTVPNSIDWKKVILRLLEIHQLFNQEAAPAWKIKDDLIKFHLTKTEERLNSLRNTDFWSDMLNRPSFIINDAEYPNIDFDQLLKCLNKYSYVSKPAVVHGDYCLSNILYDFNSDSVKLIDPRGYLFEKSRTTIYGDAHYDFAKLMHSIHGLYDFIVQGKYALIELEPMHKYYFSISSKNYSSLVHILDSDSRCHNALEYRRILEVLLFVTMIPLHYEDPKRQLAFYLRAIQLYSELLPYIEI